MINNSNSKTAQNNFGIGRVELPIGYNGAPHIRHRNNPFPWTDAQTQLPASSLDPSDLSSQTACIIRSADFCNNALDRQDTECLMTIGWPLSLLRRGLIILHSTIKSQQDTMYNAQCATVERFSADLLSMATTSGKLYF